MSRIKHPYKFRPLRTLMFLLYYEGECIERKKGGYLKITKFSLFCLAVGIPSWYMTEDLEHLQSLGLLLELKRGYNKAEMYIKAPAFI